MKKDTFFHDWRPVTVRMNCDAPFAAYLDELEEVDYSHPLIRQKIGELRAIAGPSEVDRVRIAFEFVRDQVPHSCDIQSRQVTCTASEVLQAGEGICEAKAHLLAALLRAQGIPTGFCYQRLLRDEEQGGYCLHCFNAAYLADLQRWLLLDARGNNANVQVEFSLELPRTAYTARSELGEIDYPTIYARPNPGMLSALKEHTSSIEQCLSALPAGIE